MNSPRPRFILACSVASLLTAASSQAQTLVNWTGTTDQTWNTPTNWDAGAVPDNANTTAFPNGANAVVDIATGNYPIVNAVEPSPNDIFVGTGNGTAAGVAGRLDVTAGSLANTGSAWTYVGIGAATGTLNIANTAATGGTFTGFGTGSGSYNVGFRLFVGGGQNGPSAATPNYTGTGTLNINTTGTMTVPNDTYVGGSGGGVGTLNLDAGTFNHTGGWMFIGGDFQTPGGTGTVNQSGGVFNSADTYLGRGAGSTGTYNLTGGALNISTTFFLGTAGNNGVSTFTQSGANTATTVGGELQIGNSTPTGAATNTFTVNAGTVTVSSWLAVGRAGGTGTLNINGGTVTKSATGGGFFDVGAGGGAGPSNGTVNLNGGTLQVPKIINEQGTGTFNFNGGVLLANGDGTANQAGSTTFLQGLTTANVRGGGAVINSGGFNITIAQPLVHSTVAGDSATVDGGLIKQGTGVLTMTGANTYLGSTTVNGGGLSVTGSIGSASAPAGSLFAVAGTTLSGTGTLTLGANTVNIVGTLAPGATSAAGDVGTLTIATTGSFTLTSTAQTQIDITTAANKDLITATGAKLALGGTLALNLGTGVGAGTYTIFSGLGAAPTGAFSSVTGLPAGDTSRFAYDATTGNYNLIVAVPEPSTWTLGLLGLGAAGLWLRRRRVA